MTYAKGSFKKEYVKVNFADLANLKCNISGLKHIENFNCSETFFGISKKKDEHQH